MAQTLLGDGNVTATGRVSGDSIRAASLAKYEIGTATKTSDLSQELAAKRDRTDNTCHQTTSGFSPWRATLPSGYEFGETQPTFDSTTSKWTWYVEGTGVAVDAESGASTADATSATFTFNDSGTKTFTATRFAAVESTENENYVTKSYVASQFSSDNTSLVGVLPYGYETPTLTDDSATTAFDSTTAYAVGAYVKYDSEGGTNYSNYVCIAATTAGTLPTDTTYWANVTNKTCTAVDGATNRITVGESQTVTVTLPVPASSKTAECILRFNSPISLIGGVQVAAPSGKTFTYLDISGDDVEASTATETKYYEQFYAIMPTATANAYEVTVSTRALTARAS